MYSEHITQPIGFTKVIEQQENKLMNKVTFLIAYDSHKRAHANRMIYII